MSHMVMDWITALTFIFSNRLRVYQDSLKGMIIFLIDHILSHKLHIQQKIKLIAHFF